MIRAIALDDEPPALRVLTHFCQQVEFIELKQTFTRTDEAQQYIMESGVDLLFLDINMPFISGTDFYRAISESDRQPPMVIFTTAYAEYAVEGFTLNAVDYLLKPFTFERFLQAVTKANEYASWQQRSKPADDHLYIRADYTIYKVSFADILFIEGLDDYLKVHLASTNRPIVARMTMKAIAEKLPDAQFIRVHRSYIVPFARIDGLRNKTILLTEREIPIGASYEAALLSRFRT
ncbi:LytR/AlgR family response regulator transcription factor [Fibrivirga algicola]|uniref:Response regulator transcription factor n=1 Tax=Fibrivirga algicola TaxID=2950420 RepID=A0ABX0QFE2_9BACT|nr:LytTR family DNA-binding domain-containing protein [Fibrivirga algicola]NID09951.1 response regulator transcription factor [Fibrivirga algicola]